MIPFFLFIATAIATCLLTIAWGAHGTASEGVQNVGYVAAAVMALAAYVSAFTLWAGRGIAAVALIIAVIYCLCDNVGIGARVITLNVALELALLVVAAVYVIGSFRVTTQNPLYPRHASSAGKIVVWACLVAPFAWFAWWAVWHDASHDEEKTVPANWETVTLDRVTSGRRQMKFTALDSSVSVTVASDELYNELKAGEKKSVDLLIKETFKHGTQVSWTVETIDGRQDFSLLDKEPK